MNNSDDKKHGYELDQEEDQYARQRRKTREAYEASPNFCLHCGEKILFDKRRNKFCDSSCSATYTNQRRPSISKRSRVCSCGNPKKLVNKYCKECIDNNVYSNKVTVLEEAKSDKIRRRILLDERGWQCESCDLTEWKDQPIPLELHHIDGDADNNEADNLQMICPNCHALTDTYKTKNIGNQDSNRQKMRCKCYKDNKTF